MDRSYSQTLTQTIIVQYSGEIQMNLGNLTFKNIQWQQGHLFVIARAKINWMEFRHIYI